jgi:twitching motility two-component system response regulator PilG
VAAPPLVMVIDDSPTVCKIVEVALGREGYEVVSFSDGVEALRAMTTGYVRVPNLILLDICMPRMNGYQVARYIRSKPDWKHIPIVIVSRCSGVFIRINIRLMGAQELIEKPFRTERLLEVVGAWVR